ncbi:class I SAM-dependent methyltransferase [Patescibacteria group bacterium]|nr:class I SAM-dependent methyltransferase [Patescibacteria group bacterium]
MAKKKVILHLGCGTTRMKDAINIDSFEAPTVDKVMDLEKFPYPFCENSVDEIHMYFVLEHLRDHVGVMKELHRILKPGGILYIRVPHGSSVYGQWGAFTHLKGYGYRAFDEFTDELASGLRILPRFNIIKRKVKYFLTYPYDFYKFNTWYPEWENKWFSPIVKLYVNFIQFLIDLNPDIFERFWCFWVGGAAEVYIELEKV